MSFHVDAKNIDDIRHISFYEHDGKVCFRESRFSGLSKADREMLVGQLNAALEPVKKSWEETLKQRLRDKLS